MVRSKADKLECGKFQIDMKKKKITMKMVRQSGRLPVEKWNLHPLRAGWRWPCSVRG